MKLAVHRTRAGHPILYMRSFIAVKQRMHNMHNNTDEATWPYSELPWEYRSLVMFYGCKPAVLCHCFVCLICYKYFVLGGRYTFLCFFIVPFNILTFSLYPSTEQWLLFFVRDCFPEAEATTKAWTTVHPSQAWDICCSSLYQHNPLSKPPSLSC